MKRFSASLFLILCVFVSELRAHDLNPAFVRIRLQKELEHFPVIQRAYAHQISGRMWSVRSFSEFSYINAKKTPAQSFIIKKNNGRFDVVGLVDFSHYLASVVASEMPTSWPLEALKAQAVVARSYALARMQERKKSYFHLDADQADQVYRAEPTVKTRQAVAETDGIILTYASGRVLKAYYHADCGGETVQAQQVWGEREINTGTAQDPWCANRESNRWQASFSRPLFFQQLGVDAKTVSANQELAVSAEETPQTQKINIFGTEFSVQSLRALFGFNRIRSAMSRVLVTEEKVIVSGQGYGHGAGLCQWGTLSQVRAGKKWAQILKHYYPQARFARTQVNLTLGQSQKPAFSYQ